jgi:hypothetical protein
MENRKDKIAILSIIISVFLFLFISKTLISGYHFVDDHEVIRIKNDLRSSSLINVTKNWVKEDLNSNARFRPVYSIHRVFETKLLGSDFVLWSLYNGVLCCLTLIFFYLGMRNMKFALGESIAFLIITFIGPQSSVWWRLGPGESLGMVFLGLSFYFMSRSLERRNYFANNLLFIFFLILASLTKESFLIIIPGMIFFKIWNEKNYIWSSLKESVYKNLLLLVPLMVLVIELFIIKYFVGTVYSGLDAKFINIITSILFNSMYFVKTYLNLFIVSLLLLIIYWLIKKRIVEFNLFSITFFILIFTPNIILFAKSGLVERYLLPSTLGLGFLVATFIKGFEEKPGWFKKMSLTLVLVSLLPIMLGSFNDAVKFSKEGLATKRLLSAISTNYVNGTQAMVIVDPVESYENSVSLKTYLFYENKIDLFGYGIIKDENRADYQRYFDGWKSYFNGKQFENMTSKPGLLIFLDNQMIDEFFKTSKLSRYDYLPIEIGDSPFALFKKTI